MPVARRVHRERAERNWRRDPGRHHAHPDARIRDEKFKASFRTSARERIGARTVVRSTSQHLYVRSKQVTRAENSGAAHIAPGSAEAREADRGGAQGGVKPVLVRRGTQAAELDLAFVRGGGW
tara:strand:- start:15007 stop:15375 length:369 start_codon:yes stop_codon:yes gene_type:complete